MRNVHNFYQPAFVINQINHPIIADAKPVGIFFAYQFSAAGRSWICFEVKQALPDTTCNLNGQTVEVALGAGLQADSVQH
jgi:hypothetical protein